MDLTGGWLLLFFVYTGRSEIRLEWSRVDLHNWCVRNCFCSIGPVTSGPKLWVLESAADSQHVLARLNNCCLKVTADTESTFIRAYFGLFLIPSYRYIEVFSNRIKISTPGFNTATRVRWWANMIKSHFEFAFLLFGLWWTWHCGKYTCLGAVFKLSNISDTKWKIIMNHANYIDWCFCSLVIAGSKTIFFYNIVETWVAYSLARHCNNATAQLR